ncbi:MAG: hypothetical protein QM765_45335 [Myxococcales bacterium]
MIKVKLLLVGILLIACSTKSASDFATSDMVADMTATATGNGGTSVSATLREEGTALTFIQLTSDDELIASQGSDSRSMGETSLLGLVTYNANFNKDAADTTFHVKLTRKKDGGAPDSYASLPKPFGLAPLAASEFSRTTPITVTWTTDSSTDKMSLGVAGDCIEGYQGALAANATQYVIEANGLKKRTPSSADDKVADSCDATLTITRSRSGTVDAAFHSGSFTASQVRSVKFVTKP